MYNTTYSLCIIYSSAWTLPTAPNRLCFVLITETVLSWIDIILVFIGFGFHYFQEVFVQWEECDITLIGWTTITDWKNDRQKVASQSRDFSRPHSIEYSTVKKAEAKIVRMQTMKIETFTNCTVFFKKKMCSIIFLKYPSLTLQEQWKQYTYQTIRCRPTSMARRSPSSFSWEPSWIWQMWLGSSLLRRTWISCGISGCFSYCP